MTTPGEGGGAAGRAEGSVDDHAGRPFDSIESAHEYVGLLLQAIQETADVVGEDLRHTHSTGSARREAFQLIAYKLGQLLSHVATSRRLLTDLRTLRCMLEGRRSVTPMAS